MSGFGKKKFRFSRETPRRPGNSDRKVKIQISRQAGVPASQPLLIEFTHLYRHFINWNLSWGSFEKNMTHFLGKNSSTAHTV